MVSGANTVSSLS